MPRSGVRLPGRVLERELRGSRYAAAQARAGDWPFPPQPQRLADATVERMPAADRARTRPESLSGQAARRGGQKASYEVRRVRSLTSAMSSIATEDQAAQSPSLV